MEVALGQGQTDAAAAAVQSAAAAGTWVCLKNAHLAAWWLPQLERLLQQLACHADFRLWLTSEPHPLIPAGLLSICLVRPSPSCLLMTQSLPIKQGSPLACDARRVPPRGPMVQVGGPAGTVRELMSCATSLKESRFTSAA